MKDIQAVIFNFGSNMATVNMTKDELVKELETIYNGGEHDPEAAHVHADEVLLKYINDERVRQAYDKIDKWYA